MSAGLVTLLFALLVNACLIPPAIFAWQFYMQRPVRVYVQEVRAREMRAGRGEFVRLILTPASLPQAVFTVAECESMVQTVNIVDKWTKNRHSHFPTDDVPINSVPELANVSTAINERRIPLLKSRYELGDSHIEMHDLFLIRYRGDDASAQNELKMHIDGTTLSFSIALSPPDAYAGGGIEFDLVETSVKAAQGALIMHPSKLLHRGATVTGGTRYVLVGFVSVGVDPMWAWTGDGDSDFPATRNGFWASCARIVHLFSEGEAEQLGEEHCKNPVLVMYKHIHNQVVSGLLEQGLESEDMNQLILLNMALLIFSVIIIKYMG